MNRFSRPWYIWFLLDPTGVTASQWPKDDQQLFLIHSPLVRLTSDQQLPYLDDPTTTRARWHCIGVNGRGKVHLWTFSLQCIFTHFGGAPSHCVIYHTFWITTAAVLIWMILQSRHRVTALVGHDSEAKMTGREDSAAHIWRLDCWCISVTVGKETYFAEERSLWS